MDRPRLPCAQYSIPKQLLYGKLSKDKRQEVRWKRRYKDKTASVFPLEISQWTQIHGRRCCRPTFLAQHHLHRSEDRRGKTDVESQSHHHGPHSFQSLLWVRLSCPHFLTSSATSWLINNWCQWSSFEGRTTTHTGIYELCFSKVLFNQYLLIQNNFISVEIFVSTLHFLNFLTVFKLALMILWAESVTHILICSLTVATLNWAGCSLAFFLGVGGTISVLCFRGTGKEGFIGLRNMNSYFHYIYHHR